MGNYVVCCPCQAELLKCNLSVHIFTQKPHPSVLPSHGTTLEVAPRDLAPGSQDFTQKISQSVTNIVFSFFFLMNACPPVCPPAQQRLFFFFLTKSRLLVQPSTVSVPGSVGRKISALPHTNLVLSNLPLDESQSIVAPPMSSEVSRLKSAASQGQKKKSPKSLRSNQVTLFLCIGN